MVLLAHLYSKFAPVAPFGYRLKCTAMKKKHILSRKKTDPSKFTFTGSTTDEKTEIQLFKYCADECIETDHLVPSSIGRFDQPEYRYWLNIYGLSNAEDIALICKQFEVHNLVIQDILDINQRSKYQEFDQFGFLTIKAAGPAGLERSTEQISFVFGSNYVISFQEHRATHFDHLRYRLRENTGILRQRGSDFLLFTMLEAILDDYFTILQQADSDTEDLGMQTMTVEPKPTLLAAIEQQKRSVHYIRKMIVPIRDFAVSVGDGENKYIEPRHLKYFHEIKDLCLTLQDSCDTIIASLESSTNMFFSLQNNRMNQVIKTLTIVTTIFIPLTFIAGIYGMNFDNMPELRMQYGYWGVWILMVVISAAMVIYFKRKRWF